MYETDCTSQRAFRLHSALIVNRSLTDALKRTVSWDTEELGSANWWVEMKQSKNSCAAGMRQGKLLSLQLMVHRHTCTQKAPTCPPNTHTSHWANQVRSPFMGVENKLKDWMLDLMGKYCYDMTCSARKRPAACPPFNPHPWCRVALLMYWPALLMHDIMIMALRALMGRRGWGSSGLCDEREYVAGENGVTQYDWTSSGPQRGDDRSSTS